MGTKKVKTLLGSLFLVLTLVSAGFGADYPTKPIKLINPFAPGGANGLLALAFQKPLEKQLDAKILVENMPGGSTKVGAMAVYNAKPDGYTLLIMSDRTWVFFYYSKVFDMKIWEKLSPIGNLSMEPYAFIDVKADSPYKTWADLVKAAKENPGKLSCGGTGSGGPSQYTMNEITKVAGIKVNYVPFAGGAAALTAVLGGHVDFRIVAPSDAYPVISAGKTRGLGVGAHTRLKYLPDVPTFKELGLGESAVFPFTRSIWGPPKLPKNVVSILTKAMERASKDPEFVKMVETQLRYEVAYMLPEKLQQETINFDKMHGQKLEELSK
jgi:tripartite-type tricarboxylate transporter receptor subunit TctC